MKKKPVVSLSQSFASAAVDHDDNDVNNLGDVEDSCSPASETIHRKKKQLRKRSSSNVTPDERFTQMASVTQQLKGNQRTQNVENVGVQHEVRSANGELALEEALRVLERAQGAGVKEGDYLQNNHMRLRRRLVVNDSETESGFSQNESGNSPTESETGSTLCHDNKQNSDTKEVLNAVCDKNVPISSLKLSQKTINDIDLKSEEKCDTDVCCASSCSNTGEKICYSFA